MRRAQQVALIAASGRPSIGDAPSSTTPVRLAGAAWDVSDAAGRRGFVGDQRNGAYLIYDDGASYVCCTHDDGTGLQVGYDPGAFVAELAGLTGTVVELPAGLRTGTQVAAAVRSALGWSGSGDVVEVPGFVGVGTSVDDAGVAAAWGNRNQVQSLEGGVIGEALATHGTTPASPRLCTAVGIYFVDADPDDRVSVTIYTGGAADSFVGTVQVAERVITPVAGINWVVLTPDEVFTCNATSLWVMSRGQCAGTTPGFADNSVVDWTPQNVMQLDVDPDTDVPSPASLAAANITTSYAIRQIVVLELRAAPYVGDASWRGVLGVHSDDVLASPLESPLRGDILESPGANVWMAVQTPNVPGMVVEDRQYANGSQHVGQFRMGGYEGGSNGTPNTATRTGVGAQGSGSATNAWVSCGGAGESVAPNVRRQIVLRGGATQDVNVLYAPNDSGFVDPPGFPSDFIGGAVAEYEMDSANPTHSVDPSVAFEATCVTAVSDVGNPGNYAGVREILIVAGDTPT